MCTTRKSPRCAKGGRIGGLDSSTLMARSLAPNHGEGYVAA